MLVICYLSVTYEFNFIHEKNKLRNLVSLKFEGPIWRVFGGYKQYPTFDQQQSVNYHVCNTQDSVR